LFLTTGRLDRAKEVLLAFAAMREGGLIPNCFDNGSGKAEYNTVDASLWYLIAAAAYSRAANEPLDDEILAACPEIIKAYRDGTAFGIKMDSSDGLIAAGDPSTQLTWMDARRDGVVFTPRHGKAVEINALWYAGLLEVAARLPEWYIQSARELPELAEWSGRNFVKAFWNEKGRRLYDCLTPRWAAGIIVGWNPIDEVRPNQVFAVSLPHSPLTIAQQRDVLACVREHLLTPVGLRTLAPGSRGYQPRYEGRLFERDRAYHNGTVWPWLIGPYAEAVLRVGKFSAGARAEALAVLRPLLKELTDRPGDQPGPIGQLAEVYDADEPRRPQGCPAQAWSVAEVLRVYVMAMEPAACPT
jgi:predicted glycogen debranching enzyme